MRKPPPRLHPDDDPTPESVYTVIDYFFDSISHGQIADYLYDGAGTGRMRKLRVTRVRRCVDQLVLEGKVTRSGVEYDGIHWCQTTRYD